MSIPLVTVKTNSSGGTGTERGNVRLKADGAERMNTAVGRWFAVLSCKPSISPVTVPGEKQAVPGSGVVQEKEKSKVSAWPGVDASANKDANANALKIPLFMEPALSINRRIHQ